MSDRSPHVPSAAEPPPAADWDAIARCLAGESDPAESARVRAWLATHPEDAALVDAVKARTVRVEQRADLTVDTERALALVKARMAAESAPRLTVERGGAPRGDAGVPAAGAGQRSWRGVGFAAAAGVAAMVAIAQFRTVAPTVAPIEYRTATGKRDSLRLPDGSIVVLAPGSRLTVAAGFGEGTREVTLDGAAFFDVQHDEAQPFTVHTAGADIHDIGTAFSVKTAGDGEVAVDVTHGIVALRARAAAGSVAPVELRAGDRGVLVRETVRVHRGTVSADDVAWTRGILSYRDASLSEVRADVRRWYGLELTVPDSALAARTLTASFRGDSASQVLRVIALALGAAPVQRGDTVVLQPLVPGGPATPR